MEQSPGPCSQSELRRSCFQAPAKYVTVRMVLAPERIREDGLLVMRYTSLQIGISFLMVFYFMIIV